MGVISHLFREYGPFRGEIPARINGVLVALEPGTSTAYALDGLQERGTLFVGPQEEIYAGMVVGENSRPADMVVNPCKSKHLTNMRSQGDGKGIQLSPPLKHSLERGLEYLAEDEYLEVTPKNLSLRRRGLILQLVLHPTAGLTGRNHLHRPGPPTFDFHPAGGQ
ncbi:MAG: GTP-binding protein TypA/BipA-like protein [Verrucomicrobiota bacterium]